MGSRSMGMIVDPNYVDDGALREQDRVPLKRYLSYQDRAKALTGAQPFFSGRETEIRTFRQVLNALSEGIQEDATIAVEAPPGAGKTALRSQFIEEIKRLPPTKSGRQWLPVALDGALALSPPEIMAAVDDAIASWLSGDLVKAGDPASQNRSAQRLAGFLGEDSLRNALSVAKDIQSRGFSAMGFSVGAKTEPCPETIQHAYRLRGKHWSKWQIVLMIDEAQRIPTNASGDASSTLSSIHQGLTTGAPISFCAFGLPGTLAALDEVGVSRRSGGYSLYLPALTEREAEMAVNRCFAQYGVEGGDVWKSALLERADGWPQHLSTYLHAACTVLEKRALRENLMGDASNSSLVEAIALGDEARMGRYKERIGRLNKKGRRFERHARALVPVFEAAGGRPLKDDVEEFLSNDLELGEDRTDAFLSAAEACGFLGPDVEDPLRYAMPIPSLAGHLLGRTLPPVPEPDAAPEGLDHKRRQRRL